MFPLRHKSEVICALSTFYAYAQIQLERPILALQTNNGHEFDNLAIRSLLSKHGIVLRLTCPYTSQQNGKAEHVLRTLNESVCALLFHASLPPHFCTEDLATTTLLLNYKPCTTSSPRTPHELILCVPPV